MSTATATSTVQQLRQLFARCGIPASIVSDNGTKFTANEFQVFCCQKGIRHIKVAPYHPSLNGIAEQAVQVFKQAFRKFHTGTIQDRIARFLVQHHNTPHTTTGTSQQNYCFVDVYILGWISFSQTWNNRYVTRSKDSNVTMVPESNTENSRRETVFVRNFCGVPRWLQGTISHQSGPLSFHVQLTDGRVIRRHIDHLPKH